MNNYYRSEIDGLRAIAVIPVVFFHAGFQIFSGGFVGVDIFFVISGYLITSIILRSLEKKTFSLSYFYERRARRILPSLFFVIFITSIFSYIFLTRSEIGNFFQSVTSSLLFYSNFYFWKTTPYFLSEADLEPLLHTWSLSIEEQFYIIFPILLIIVYNYFKKNILFFLFSIFFLSLFLCQTAAIKTSGTLNFYFTLSRAWELALGALSAYFLLKKKIIISTDKQNYISFFGMILILFSIFFFDKQTSYPSFNTLIPTFGTVLIILFANEHSIIKKILSLKVIVSIGLISYSFYLWHQPLLVFGRIYFDNFSDQLKYFTIIISLVISYFSYIFIEKPFRNKNKINVRTLIKILISFFLFFLIFSQLNINFFKSGSKNSTEARLAKLLNTSEAVLIPKIDERQFMKQRVIQENYKPQSLIVGSSRIMQLTNHQGTSKILNLAVSGATIEDQITIIEMALEKFNPNKILLGADPWLFNKNNNQERWKSLSREYKLALNNIELLKKKNKILEINSDKINYHIYEDILKNIYQFLNIRNLNINLEESNVDKTEKAIILKNGKRVYGKRDIPDKIKEKIVTYSMTNYEFSENNFKLYKKFINYLIQVHNKKIVLVLSPYTQESYKLSIKKIPFYSISESKFRQLGKELKIEIIGSYNPSNTSCKQEDFYDSMHPKDSCMKKLFAK